MSLKETLKEDMKSAMKAREEGKLALSVIRMVQSAIRNAEIDGKKELEDSDVLGILAKEVKMRKDSLEEFAKAERKDLVDHTQAELEVLYKYLPKQLSEEEVRAIIHDIVMGMEGTVTMGTVMSQVIPKLKGKADGKIINTVVKDELEKKNTI